MTGQATPQPLVDYLVLAEFDIDRGSLLRVQYPRPINCEEQFIAEQMLPDGAHNREEDWTIFFIDTAAPANPEDTNDTAGDEKSSHNGDGDISLPAHPPPAASVQQTSQLDVAMVSKPIECISYFQAHGDWQRYRPEEELCVVTFVTAPLLQTESTGESAPDVQIPGEIVVSDDVGRALVTIPLRAEVVHMIHEASLSDGTLSTFVEISNLNLLPPVKQDLDETGDSGSPPDRVGLLLSSISDGKLFTQWMQSQHRTQSDLQRLETPSCQFPVTMENDFRALMTRTQLPSTVVSTTTSEPTFFYCINFLKTKKSATIRRGASVKALALCSSQQHSFCAFKPLLRHALELIFDAPDERVQEVLADLYNVINSVDLSNFPRPSPLKRQVWRWSIVERKPLQLSKKLSFHGKDFDVLVPFCLEPDDEIGDDRISVTKLVRKFKENTMTLFNAILTERRVLFLGHNHSAGDVCFYVLSAAQMVCPPLRGLVQKGRIHPYASLVNLQFLNQVGYIAGVTNPMFEHREAWWDILCDLDTGKIKKNPHTWHADDGAYSQHDQKFIANTISMINAHALKGVNPLYSEDMIRAHFNTYAREITDLGFETECVFIDEDTKRDMLESNTTRLAHWKMTSAYQRFLQDRKHTVATRATKELDVQRHVRMLQVCRNLEEDVILSILQDLVRHVRTEEQLLELLSFLPESLGGLYPLAVVMFHPGEAVRLAAVALFRRLDTFKEGSRCISLLNTFLMLTYERNSRLMPKTDHT